MLFIIDLFLFYGEHFYGFLESENGFGHFKELIKPQARVVIRKKLFVILYSALQKLNKLSILSILITNYSSVYSICFFYQFI